MLIATLCLALFRWEFSKNNLKFMKGWGRNYAYSYIVYFLVFIQTPFLASGILHCEYQGRSEGASSEAFEVLIIKSDIDFIKLFIFNCLTSNINLFNIIFFASRRERMFMDLRP